MGFDIVHFLVTNPGGYSITVTLNDKFESNELATSGETTTTPARGVTGV